MSSYDVTLSSATRQNLLSLQDTSALTAINQNRLSTGKKVNSALDNPVNYFTSQSLTGRASALTGLLDGISNGIQTIQAASKGIDSITSMVQSLQSTVSQAQNDAANNYPSATGTNAIAASKSAALSTATGFSSGSTVTIAAGAKSFTYTGNGSDTVQDFVNAVNNSGFASASVDSTGHLNISGTGSDTLTVTPAKAGGSAAPDLTALGFTSGQVATLGTGVAAGVSSSTVRSNLVSQFNNLTKQINQLAKDSGYNGTNLLGGNNLNIVFNEKTGLNQSALTVDGQSLTAISLGIKDANDGTVAAGNTSTQFNIQSDSDLSSLSDNLTDALTQLKSLSSSLGSSLSVVQTRQDFTKNLADVLQTGSDNLTNADMNAEAVNSQALSTRQSLGISALSLANTANQGILQLLR